MILIFYFYFEPKSISQSRIFNEPRDEQPSGSNGFVYCQRCIRLDLTSLKERRKRGDMITMFKLKNRIRNGLGKGLWSRLDAAGVIGKDVRQYAAARNGTTFINSAIGPQNDIPDEVVDIATVKWFQEQFRGTLEQHCLKGRRKSTSFIAVLGLACGAIIIIIKA